MTLTWFEITAMLDKVTSSCSVGNFQMINARVVNSLLMANPPAADVPCMSMHSYLASPEDRQ